VRWPGTAVHRWALDDREVADRDGVASGHPGCLRVVRVMRHRLIVEIDGYAYHSATGAYVRDRQRQNVVVLAGWRVLRFTAVDVFTRGTEIVDEVRRALGA
jgi:hypothetical protein